MTIQEGQVFGNYRILGRLGVGGMGAVYLAEHPLIGKRVALKVIHKELAGNQEIVMRFFNEARAVNKIGNEHIVEINDFGQTADGAYFFIMEYLEGRTLAHVLAHERIVDIRRALHIGAQIASGLGAAHACAIIHRDLKPDNIMLVPHLGNPDFVKILDFGLAKMFAESGTNLTAHGMVLGTPQYMSPEACESRKGIDPRADIYSLGILLFQMVTGRLPFDGHTMGEVLVKQVTHPPPPPRAINPAIPPSVEQIILRCLAKLPAARFGTMEELRHALLDPDRYLASSPPVMPTAAVPGQREHAGRSGVGRTTGPEIQAVAPGPAALAAHAAAAMTGPNQPVVPENRTMRIDTPTGYRVPRRWPVIVAALAVALVSGSIALLALPSEGGEGRVDAGVSPSAASSVALSVDATLPAPDAAPPAPATGTIVVRTEPAGAEIFDEAGKLLGKTPTEIELPIDGKEHLLVVRHPMAKELQKRVQCTGDGELELELELIEQDKQAPRPRPRTEPPRQAPKKPPSEQLIDISGMRF